MESSRKPPVHLWVFNHPFTGISDQVEFFVSALRQNGYVVTVGKRPSRTSLNVVIENFSPTSKKILADFCVATRKRVAVIMTEHLDFENGQLFIHGDPLWSDNDYMHPATQITRIRYLFDCLPFIRCFLVLGDLPELANISTVLPGIDVRSISFPDISPVEPKDRASANESMTDLLFTGFITNHRASIISLLRERSFSLACPEKFVSKKNRDAMNQGAKLILNIPQRRDWRWLSLMRVIAALRCGRATVSLGTRDNSEISNCCFQLDLSSERWTEQLRQSTSEWKFLYKSAHEDYMTMKTRFEISHPFPHDMLEFWAITDRL